MEEIDAELSEQDCPYHQRPSHAFTKLANRVDEHGEFVMLTGEEVSENDFSNDALYEQVNRWYKNRYGERIKIHPGPGSCILIIKNEPWEVVLPLCYGLINFTVDTNLNNVKRWCTVNGQEIPEVNILCHVKDMTHEIASNLSDVERADLLKDFLFGLTTVQSLKDHANAAYIEQAKSDYDAAIYNIFSKNPDYNNSKWASLQFAEKTMKSKLEASGGSFNRTHNLYDLAERLENVGIGIPRTLIDNIQCSAGVRYGEVSVSRMEAVTAVRNALVIYFKVYHE
jgi:HEPN domain-containing protein